MAKRRSKKRKHDEDDEVNDLIVVEPEELVPVAEVPDTYLTEELAAQKPALRTIVQPDLQRCQCEWRDLDVETFGPKPFTRCEQEPSWIAFQKRTNDEEPTGMCSLCDDHKVIIEHLYPGQCYFRLITDERKIGDSDD